MAKDDLPSQEGKPTCVVTSTEPILDIKKRKIEPETQNPPEKTIFFHKLSPNATTPTLGSPQSAGYDLYAAHDTEIPVGHRKLIKTDIQIDLPPNYYGRVAPRSGLAYKSGIDVMAGVIDRDYRGNVGVILVNLDFMDEKVFSVKKGDRVAQLVVEGCLLDSKIIECPDKLEETTRGAGGFGSTGKR